MLAMLTLVLSAAAADLFLEDETVQLSGSWSFDRVVLREGATIRVSPYDGTPGSGTLRLHATSIFVEEGATIDANGAGYQPVSESDGDGPGGGLVTSGTASSGYLGGGGAHAGAGGMSVYGCYSPMSDQGMPYGLSSGRGIALGSAGGSVSTSRRTRSPLRLIFVCEKTWPSPGATKYIGWGSFFDTALIDVRISRSSGVP